MPTPHNEDKLIGGQMMNYEVNPFQDYESITVDELKGQANSLLNLVTEERRPHLLSKGETRFPSITIAFP